MYLCSTLHTTKQQTEQTRKAKDMTFTIYYIDTGIKKMVVFSVKKTNLNQEIKKIQAQGFTIYDIV